MDAHLIALPLQAGSAVRLERMSRKWTQKQLAVFIAGKPAGTLVRSSTGLLSYAARWAVAPTMPSDPFSA